MGRAWLAALFMSCVALDEVQTPNADVDLSPEAGAAGQAGSGSTAESDCAAQGWAFVRIDGRDQLASWSAPVLAQSCGAAPHRLSAVAPRLGSAVLLDLSVNGGRVVEAIYSTTGVGGDGEEWGSYDAVIDVESVSFGVATVPAQQPFELAGTILGPFGPVSIAMSGCARLRPSSC